jgi:hypothetical protein
MAAQHAAYLAAEKELEDIFSSDRGEVGQGVRQQGVRQLEAAPKTPDGMPRRRAPVGAAVSTASRGALTGTVAVASRGASIGAVGTLAPATRILGREGLPLPLLPYPDASPTVKAEPVALTQEELVQSLHAALDRLPNDLVVANMRKRAFDPLSELRNDMRGPPPKKAPSTSVCARLNRDGNPRPRGGRQSVVRPIGQLVPPPVKLKPTSKLTLLETPKPKPPARGIIFLGPKSEAPLLWEPKFPVVPKLAAETPKLSAAEPRVPWVPKLSTSELEWYRNVYATSGKFTFV